MNIKRVSKNVRQIGSNGGHWRIKDFITIYWEKQLFLSLEKKKLETQNGFYREVIAVDKRKF